MVETASAAEGAGSTAATATATAPAKGRIAIVLTSQLADQHKADLDKIMDGIKALVKGYNFIGGVGMEVTA